MFGEIRVGVKNLLTKVNTWRQQNTYQLDNLGTTPGAWLRYRNTTPATLTVQQVSPALEMEGQGYKSGSPAASRNVKFRNYVLPVTGSSNPIGYLRWQYSLNDSTYVDAFEWQTTYIDGTSFPLFKTYSFGEFAASGSNQDPATTTHLMLTNVSGSFTNLAFKFGSTFRSAIIVGNDGSTRHRINGASGVFEFQIGSSIASGTLVCQMSAGGLYTNGFGAFTGDVSAGGGDITPPADLNSLGSFAVKGVRITAATYSISREETVIYGDADTAFLCSGTATACNTYGTEGACNAHTLAGCSWNPGNSCSDYNGDQGTCTGTAGCTWETADCVAFGDQTSCEAQSPCVWSATGDCSTDGSGSQGTCESLGGGGQCTWNFSDCSAFNGSDQGTCEANSGCVWDDGSSTCSGQYNTSCSGSYNKCSGSYDTGSCLGTYGSGCVGTALCSNLTDDGSVACAAESGCTWSTGGSYELPSTTVANDGNTSRLYFIMNIGSTGNIAITAASGDTLHAAITLTPGQRAIVHSHVATASCTGFSDVGTCTPSGCNWTAATCADFGADEATCNAQSGNGCTWSGSSCDGTYSGTAGACTGTYTLSKKWYRLSS